VAAYVTLDEALAGGLRVREVDESGSVPELVVENPLDSRVLLYDGEELVGAKQNRILNVSVLVEAKTTLRIPVSCVEQGRWSRRSAFFSAGGHVAHVELRRRKAEAQAAQPLARGIHRARSGTRCTRERWTSASPHLPARAQTSSAHANHSLASRQPSVGLGEDLRLRNDRVIGSGLVLGDETIQLSAFRSEHGGQRAFGRIARPSSRR